MCSFGFLRRFSAASVRIFFNATSLLVTAPAKTGVTVTRTLVVLLRVYYTAYASDADNRRRAEFNSTDISLCGSNVLFVTGGFCPIIYTSSPCPRTFECSNPFTPKYFAERFSCRLLSRPSSRVPGRRWGRRSTTLLARLLPRCWNTSQRTTMRASSSNLSPSSG